MSGATTTMTADEQRKQRLQLTTITAVAAVFANVAFLFLSKAYWQDRSRRFGPQEIDFVGTSRTHFAMFTGIVAVVLIAAVFKPRIVSTIVAVVATVAALAASYFSFKRDMPSVIPAACLLIGCALPALTYFTEWKLSRAAWAGLTNLFVVLAVVLLFGAPKIAGLFHSSLWTAMLGPGILTAAVAALVSRRGVFGSVST